MLNSKLLAACFHVKRIILAQDSFLEKMGFPTLAWNCNYPEVRNCLIIFYNLREIVCGPKNW